MRKNRYTILLGMTLMVFFLGSCNLPLPVNEDNVDSLAEITAPSATPDPPAPTEQIQPTSATEDKVEIGSTRLFNFDQLGISMEVPADLYVHKDPLVSYDDPTKLEGYLFYIQNYGFPGGPNTGDFQIYGHLQYDLPSITWEQFADNNLNSPMNAYATEIEVNDLRGFDTQVAGVRNRFVYHFLLDGHVLTMALAAPTEENKALADQIVSTMLFNPENFTNASKMQKVNEPNFHYQMYIPADWKYNFEPTAGVRISDLRASSADANLVVEETDGPHSNFHYKSGIFMNLVIQEGNSALMEPVMAKVIRSDQIMISGIEMYDYVFREPSTVEGEIRELRFLQDGLSYQLRFSYSKDIDQDLIEWIILNLEISQD